MPLAPTKEDVSQEMEQMKDRLLDLRVNALVLFQVIAAVQLAGRHPSIPEDLRAFLRHFTDHVKPGFPTNMQRLIDLGWDPQHDEVTHRE
jgi:hypothetical protein